MRFQPCLETPAAGSYTFYTTSDDGSKLFIGTTQVVNNDGLHGSQESDHLEDEIPNLEMVLKLQERSGLNIRDINLRAQERRVIAYANARNTLQQIASSTGLSDLEIRRVVYSLMQAGIVEITRPEGMHQPYPVMNRAPRSAPDGVPAQKSLINRLINRIRAM